MLAAMSVSAVLQAEEPDSISYSVSLNMNYSSSGNFTPYMLGSWNHGRYVAGRGAYVDVAVEKAMKIDSRFSWGAGAEALAGVSSAADYDRWTQGEGWSVHSVHQPAVKLISLYGSVKFRGVFMTVGMKPHKSYIVDGKYSSGDLIRSNNANPIPGVEVGFVDFQDIPFTNGWVQIEGRIMYGRLFDNSFVENRYNYYTDLIANDLCYTYKRCYFRTKPTQPLSITVGMQTAGLFGGNTRYYRRGEITSRVDRGFRVKDLWEMFFPSLGSGEGYYLGSSLGSWDFNARYDVPGNHGTLEAYFEWPWEDGSGIGRRNGWDGIWGLSYDTGRHGWFRKAVVEYLDFRNHSGPLHFAPNDRPGTDITTEATGGDNYFNNDVYGPYAYFGMAIGSPFLLSPVYNTDGFWQFAHNRAQGFHLAAGGDITGDIEWIAKVSYQKAWGGGREPKAEALHDTSALLGVSWSPSSLALNGWNFDCSLALDNGTLRGNNFGAAIAVRYSGNIMIKRSKK